MSRRILARSITSLVFLLGTFLASASTNKCAICGVEFKDRFFIVTDKVTEHKESICPACAEIPRICFLCGLPVKENFAELPDGRFICSRDGKTAVLDQKEAEQLVEEVTDALDRLFSRFASFSKTNVQTQVIDRVDLQALFRTPGQDYSCPNVLGYFQTFTNRGVVRHSISLLSGLPRAEFKAVIAHEFSHAWVFDNVPESRKDSLGRDAQEGFCELIAYLLLGSTQDTEGQQRVMKNHYTRGQIDLFVEAERRFGLNDVLDWMRYGMDSVLSDDDPTRVRRIQPSQQVGLPKYGTRGLTPIPVVKPSAPDHLTLKGILYSTGKPVAIINGQTLGLKEEAAVPLGTTNVLIRCLDIQKDHVRVLVLRTGEEQDLRVSGW